MVHRDIIDVTRSVSGKLIRLTAKQWVHIVESHDYMAGNMDKVLETVYSPDFIVRGSRGELIALKHYPETNISEKYCVVVYREFESDGFIITAFFTSKPETIKRRGIIWRRGRNSMSH